MKLTKEIESLVCWCYSNTVGPIWFEITVAKMFVVEPVLNQRTLSNCQGKLVQRTLSSCQGKLLSRKIGSKDFVQLSRKTGSDDCPIVKENCFKGLCPIVKGNWFRGLCPVVKGNWFRGLCSVVKETWFRGLCSVVKETWFCYYVGLFPEGAFMLRIYDTYLPFISCIRGESCSWWRSLISLILHEASIKGY